MSINKYGDILYSNIGRSSGSYVLFLLTSPWPMQKASKMTSHVSPLLCPFPNFPDFCLGGDKSGESWRPLLGGDMSGESWRLLLGGDVSGESWRPLLGGDMSGESWRPLLGGDVSGESCRVFLTGESGPLLFDDSSGESWRLLLDATGSGCWWPLPSPSSVSSFPSAIGRETQSKQRCSLHRKKFS